MNKLQRLTEMQNQIDALKAEMEQEAKVEVWKPKGDFRIGGNVFVYGGLFDSSYAKHGNVRTTRELAERAIKRRRAGNIIAAYVDEYAPDYEPDWNNDGEQKKYSIRYSHTDREWGLSHNWKFQSPGVVYMPEHIAYQLLADIESGRVVL